jgi:hypothetical protein
LEISPAGGKWWRLKYRFDRTEKRVSLGIYPNVSPRNARERRDAARKLLAEGVDPSENRKAQKAARADRTVKSFEFVAREWSANYSPTWAANHSRRIIRLYERDIFPWIGGRSAALAEWAIMQTENEQTTEFPWSPFLLPAVEIRVQFGVGLSA